MILLIILAAIVFVILARIFIDCLANNVTKNTIFTIGKQIATQQELLKSINDKISIEQSDLTLVNNGNHKHLKGVNFSGDNYKSTPASFVYGNKADKIILNNIEISSVKQVEDLEYFLKLAKECFRRGNQ